MVKNQIAEKIVWVQRPHQKPVRMGARLTLEELYRDFGLSEYCSTYSDYRAYSKTFEPEDYQYLEKAHQAMKQAGIRDHEPFAEFKLPGMDSEFIRLDKFSPMQLLVRVIKHDMYMGHLFRPGETETNEKYAQRIFDETRGHNAPTMRQIETILGI